MAAAVTDSVLRWAPNTQLRARDKRQGLNVQNQSNPEKFSAVEGPWHCPRRD